MKKHKAIRILDVVKTGSGWQFAASVDDFTFAIKLSRDYHRKLTGGAVEPARLVEASLHFLLERESPEQILPQFYLSQINNYFSDYETAIQAYL